MNIFINFKRLLLYIIVFSISVAPGKIIFASHIPESGGHRLEGEYNIRVFMKKDDFNLMGETDGRFEGSNKDFRYHSVTIGPYYRLHRNLKLGAFYKLQRGVWHDDDWILLEDDTWKWRDTSSRNEHVFVLDASPRVQLPFLPGSSWVGELKSRYYYNAFNDHQTITVRSGITYFWLDKMQPFLNFYLQYEMYFPLNYGKALIYERWIYLGTLYHLNSMFKFGIFGAERQVVWGESEDFNSRFPDENYKVTYKSFMIGVNTIINFPI